MSSDRSNKTSSSKSRKDSRKEDTNCGKCDGEVGRKDHALKCDMCEMWHHTSCEGVGDSLYKAIQNAEADKTQGLHWYCKKCNRFASRFMTGLQRLSARQDAMEEKFGVLEVKVSKKLKEVDDSQEDLVKKVQSLEERVGKHASESVGLTVKEVQDRQERRRNIVFFNLAESSAEDPKQVKSDDLDTVSGILDQVGIKVPITNPTRLGKKESTSARPLRIQTANEEDATRVLGIERKLREIETLNTIYVNKDRTPLEREEWKKLLVERKDKNQESRAEGKEENWIIRNNRVVQGKPRDLL